MSTVPRTLLAAALLLVLPAPGPGQPPGQSGATGRGLPPGALARLGMSAGGNRAFLSGLALTPDGKTLAVADDRTTVRLLSTATGGELRRFTVPDQGATYLAFTPDGRGLACGAHRGPVRVFSAATGEQTAQYGDAEWWLGPLVFSADGSTLAAGNDTFADEPVPLPVWDTATGKLRARVVPAQNFRVGAALSSDGRALATWGQYFSPGRKDAAAERERGRTIQVWDVQTGKEARRLRAGSAIARAAFAPDGRTLAVATEGAITLWDVATGKEVREGFAWRGQTVSLAFAPDGRTVAAAARSGTVARWPVAGGEPRVSSWGPPGSAPQLAYLADGRLAACGVERQRPALWDVAAEKSLLPAAGHQTVVTGLSFPAQPGQLRSVDAEGTVLLWDTRTSVVVRHARLSGARTPSAGHHNWFDDITFSPDGRYMLGMGTGTRTCVWDSETGKFLCDLPGIPGRQAGGGARGGKPVVVTCDRVGPNAVLSVWEVPAGRLVRRLKDFHDSSCAVLSPDGKTLAAATARRDQVGYRELTLLEPATGKLLHRVNDLHLPIAFSPDSETLLAHDGKCVGLIDVASGKKVRSFGERSLLARDWIVAWAVAFSPCGRLLTFATTQQGQVEVVEIATGSRRFVFRPDYAIRSLAFSPDGKMLATGGHDGTILLWDLVGRGREAALTPQELEAAWAALADADGQKGWQAMRRLADAPRDGVPFLGNRLKPLYAGGLPEEATLRGLLTRLDSNRFQEREKASEDIARLGRVVKPFLVKALKAGPSLEVRRRLERLLEGMSDHEATAEEVRQLRALEVLEGIGTEEARRVAAPLTEERAGTLVSRAARATLARWKKMAP